jgi:hypothetical protein|eukprot:COSAG02_NODE_1553_length_11961_cov_5.094335_5_plen_44_part_00
MLIDVLCLFSEVCVTQTALGDYLLDLRSALQVSAGVLAVWDTS